MSRANDERQYIARRHYRLGDRIPHERVVPKAVVEGPKRAVRRRTLTIEVDNGEVYVQKQKKRVKVIASREEQVRILNSCHSDATSGHLVTRKTRRKIAQRFYWKGLSYEVKNLWPLTMFARG